MAELSWKNQAVLKSELIDLTKSDRLDRHWLRPVALPPRPFESRSDPEDERREVILPSHTWAAALAPHAWSKGSKPLSIVAVETGIPYKLLQTMEWLFLKLPERAAFFWPEQFLEAVPVGRDLSSVYAQFQVWLLKDRLTPALMGTKLEKTLVPEAIVLLTAPADRRGIVARQWAALYEKTQHNLEGLALDPGASNALRALGAIAMSAQMEKSIHPDYVLRHSVETDLDRDGPTAFCDQIRTLLEVAGQTPAM